MSQKLKMLAVLTVGIEVPASVLSGGSQPPIIPTRQGSDALFRQQWVSVHVFTYMQVSIHTYR